MHRTRTQKRFTTWLAMLAMGLLLFAPTISRTAQALEHQPASAMQCAEHVMSDDHHMGGAAHAGGQNSLDACAYCSLLHDNPVLLLAVAVLSPLVPVAAVTLSCQTPAAPYLWPLDLCPRGPPQS